MTAQAHWTFFTRFAQTVVLCYLGFLMASAVYSVLPALLLALLGQSAIEPFRISPFFIFAGVRLADEATRWSYWASQSLWLSTDILAAILFYRLGRGSFNPPYSLEGKPAQQVIATGYHTSGQAEARLPHRGEIRSKGRGKSKDTRG